MKMESILYQPYLYEKHRDSLQAFAWEFHNLQAQSLCCVLQYFEHNNQISAFASATFAIDVNTQGVNKGAGLKHLLEKMGMTGDDLIAFGDGGNDIDMLDFAKYSYAMANGMDKVKKHAKYIAPANTENGVFKVLQKYLAEDKKQLVKLN